MGKRITKFLLLMMLFLFACVFIACNGETPGIPGDNGNTGNTDNENNSFEFYGTWKSTEKLQFSTDQITSFNDYMYLSFSNDSLVIYVPSKGSSKSLPYEYTTTNEHAGYLTITENGARRTVLLSISGDVYTINGTGFSELEISKGVQNNFQAVKISNSIEYTPEMKPEGNTEVPEVKQYTVRILIDGYTFPDGKDSVEVLVDAGTVFDEKILPPEEMGLNFDYVNTVKWFLDNSDTTFSGEINSDMTLHLKWTGVVTIRENKSTTYLVMDYTGLIDWAEDSKYDNNINCILLSDIILPNPETAEESNWTSPFPFSSFSGVFDGNGHSVSNMKDVSEGTGFIGYIGAAGVVKNLSIIDSIISSSTNTASGISSYNTGTIENCSFSGELYSDHGAYGIAGINDGTIKNCSTYGTFSSKGNTAGILAKNYGTVSNCSFDGDIYAYKDGGGIASINLGFIEGCIVNANLYIDEESTKSYPSIGGIVGYNDGGYVIGCYSEGNVFSKSSRSDNDCIGGTVGYISGSGYIVACASDSTVGYTTYNNSHIGGIAGYASRAEIRGCYFAGTYNKGQAMIGVAYDRTKSVNNVCSVGSPGIAFGQAIGNSANTTCALITGNYPWSDGTKQLNKEINSWNNSDNKYPCNYIFVQSIYNQKPNIVASI